ncbi:MAG: MgtC/SapB family protein [Candidatus Diapherotrites archaeon]|nr:MgtC/SapB family protein [Candidatus Diapherotrites archaeon]
MEGLIKLILSTLFGMVIGLERESKHKPAGIRTCAIVCMGSCLFTLVSGSFSGAADPSRVAAGIVTGIGFLGGGAIFRSRTRSSGMTTASSVWVVAAIGIATGIGEYLLALGATVIALLLLYFGAFLKIARDYSNRRKAKREANANK